MPSILTDAGAPTPEEVAALQQRVRRRVLRWFPVQAISAARMPRRWPAHSTSADFPSMPRGQARKARDEAPGPFRWYSDYIATYFERDVRRMSAIHDLSLFQR
jgi:hypothetical protein